MQVKRTEVRRKVEGERGKVGQESFTLHSEQVSWVIALPLFAGFTHTRVRVVHKNTFQSLNSHMVSVRAGGAGGEVHFTPKSLKKEEEARQAGMSKTGQDIGRKETSE